MREIKISNCNKGLLGNFAKQMMSVDKFLTIKIEDDNTTALGYFPSHDVVKLYGVKNENFFEGIDAHDKPIRISIPNAVDVLNILKYYPVDGVDMILEVYDENPSADELYTNRVVFRCETENESFEISLVCADKSFSDKVTDPISASVLERLFDTSNKLCSFTIDAAKMRTIKSFSNIDKTNRSFGYVVSDNGDVNIIEKRMYDDSDIPSDIYRMLLMKDVEGVSENHSYMCNKNIFNTMQDSNWSVDLCPDDTKVIYNCENEETGEKVGIVGVINETL